MNNERLSFLLSAYVDGVLSPEEKTELEEALLSSAACRSQFWKQTKLHDQLRTVASEGREGSPAATRECSVQVRPQEQVSRWKTEFWRRPLTAAAAGIIASALCTSAVWAYAGQWLAPKPKILALPAADFESISAMPPVGIPSEPNQWSGDYSRIVGAENGIQPHGGRQMLRFLRADNALPQSEKPNYVGEAAYVIDLRPLRAELQAGATQVDITAWFASTEGDAGDGGAGDRQFRFLLKAAAFNGTPSEAPRLWEDFAHASLSMVQRQISPATSARRWQPLTITIPIPPSANLLVFECGVLQCRPRLENGTAEFPGHYVDDVSVQLRTPAGPLPLQPSSKEAP